MNLMWFKKQVSKVKYRIAHSLFQRWSS